MKKIARLRYIKHKIMKAGKLLNILNNKFKMRNKKLLIRHLRRKRKTELSMLEI